MFRIKSSKCIMFVLIVSILLTACGGGVEATPTSEEAAEATPSKVSIAFFFCSPMDQPWIQTMYQSVQRVKEAPPLGLEIEDKWFENVPIDDYEKIVRDAILTEEYDIIWLHDASAGTDPVDNLKEQFPDQIFAVSASNYYPAGGNAYWIQAYAHESAYLCGVIAGMITDTNIAGMVAGFPYASMNHLINGFADGARSVNPDMEFKVAYVESWYDPMKYKETASAQIEAGADVIYSLGYGAFEAAQEKGLYAFGNQSDIHDLAPDTIITSPLLVWDPSVEYIIEVWYDHVVNGTPYDGPDDDPIYFLMKDGGADIAPLYEFEDKLPANVLEKYYSVKEDITNGTLKIPLKLEPIELD